MEPALEHFVFSDPWIFCLHPATAPGSLSLLPTSCPGIRSRTVTFCSHHPSAIPFSDAAWNSVEKEEEDFSFFIGRNDLFGEKNRALTITMVLQPRAVHKDSPSMR